MSSRHREGDDEAARKETAYINYQMRRNILLETGVTALCLGAVGAFSVGLVLHSLAYTGSTAELAAGLYLLVVQVLFHVAEFIVAAKLRPLDAHVDAFMVFHSREFVVANALAWAEFAVEVAVVPESWKVSPQSPWGFLFRMSVPSVLVFAALTCGFYLVRVVAMVQCGANFSLLIEDERRSGHRLVTHGLYSVLRHPAYFGWFWRTVFSQLILANPVCFVAHTAVTWVFFRRRIPYEESTMLDREYFGDTYEAYRRRTIIGIPFIST